jgi:hypothetical protein
VSLKFQNQFCATNKTAAVAGTGQNFNRGFADLARDVDVKALVDEGGGDAAVMSRVRCAFAA